MFNYHVDNYDKCNSFTKLTLGHEIIDDGSNRQARLHTCFRSCKDYIYDDFKEIYHIDTRPNCTEEEKMTPRPEQYLLCLHTDEECEQTIHHNEINVGTFQINLI